MLRSAKSNHVIDFQSKRAVNRTIYINQILSLFIHIYTSRGCTEQNEGQRIISFTSFAWISSKDKILWSFVWRILLWATTQLVQRFSTQSRHRAVAWELSSQLVHFVGFCTANTVNMLLMKKFSGNASIPLAGTGTTRRHIEQTRVRSWGL